MPKKGISNIIFAVLTVPIMIAIALAVFSSFNTAVRPNFEGTAINETLATKADDLNTTYTTAFYGKLGSGTLYNNSALCLATKYSCQIDYSDAIANKVTVTTNASGQIEVRYTPYNKGGNGTSYESYMKTYKGTLSGYTLGNMLPFILIAMVVIGVIVTALVL